MIEIDASDFDRLAADLDAAARGDLLAQIRPVVAKGSVNVKTAWNDDLAGTKWFYGALPVTFDRRDTATVAESEIGPASGGKVKGDLAVIAHFNPNTTLPDPEKYLEDEAPKLEDAVGKVLDDLLGRL